MSKHYKFKGKTTSHHTIIQIIYQFIQNTNRFQTNDTCVHVVCSCIDNLIVVVHYLLRFYA